MSNSLNDPRPIILHGNVKNGIAHRFETDAYQIRSSKTTVTSMDVFDTASYDGSKNSRGQLIASLAHRDAFQIIPPSIIRANDQYALSEIENIAIRSCVMVSNGHLQGVFSSDGLINGIEVSDCVMQTRGQHYITLNGVLGNAVFSNNLDENKNPVPVILNPARVGGNPDGKNIWISSFADYRYDSVFGENVTDNRKKVSKLRMQRGDIYLNEFELYMYRYRVQEELKYPTTGKQRTIRYARELQKLALQCGKS